MKTLTAISVIATAVFLARTRYQLNQWEGPIRQFETQLLELPPLTVSQSTSTQSWIDLPPVVQRYFQKVLSNNKKVVSSARIQQSGQYRLLLEDDTWFPLKATELLSSNPPGYVWDAVIPQWWSNMRLLDS